MGFNYTYYPVPNATDTKDLLNIFRFVSTATDGLFFPLMILVIWIVQFIAAVSQGKPSSRAWVFASFTATILSILLGILALIEQKWVYLLVIAVSIGAFWIKLATAKS
jgi:hypothetical protein